MTLAALEEYENDSKKKYALPDVVIVRKAYPKLRKRQKTRIWKLKHLEKESIYENNIWEGKKKKGKNEDQEMEDRKQQDMRDFMDEIEEDPELRSNINLYKVSFLQEKILC